METRTCDARGAAYFHVTGKLASEAALPRGSGSDPTIASQNGSSSVVFFAG
jgi:hypothetical protein